MHSLNTGHEFDFEKGKILCRGLRINKKRKIRECIEIRKRIDDVINFKTDVNSISNIYSSVISLSDEDT